MARYTEPEPLFCKVSSYQVREAQSKLVTTEIATIPEGRILNASIEDLVNYIFDKFVINVPELDVHNAAVDQSEAQVKVLGFMYGLERGRSQSVPGMKVTLEIPYTGDQVLFSVQPSTFNMSPPRASVTATHLILVQSGPNLDGDQVQRDFDRTINEIQENLDRLHKDLASFNSNLALMARTDIESRKAKLLSNQNLVSGLKFKLKQRPDAPKTYSSPIKRQTIEPRLPPVTSQAFKPEPVLPEEDYQNILKIIHDMTLVMERSPSSFATMNEEDIRQHFLVQLNGQYEGKASGETFNANGKTDILVRDDEKNIFIAECKFWRGDKSYSETIDQLLNYLSWRDTKTALIIFNRNKNFSSVLDKIKSLTKDHPLCKTEPKLEGETKFRYVFGQPNDQSRETTVTVMAFDIPGEELPEQ
ncbi:hypothetical protein NIBR502774_14905 (plasmid) [Rhizobium sp. NIBRBAC000502774]|nr:hypothetical protein NIBR502774_14905 [Rhizobium sp. NIBRBAC000502774]